MDSTTHPARTVSQIAPDLVLALEATLAAAPAVERQC